MRVRTAMAVFVFAVAVSAVVSAPVRALSAQAYVKDLPISITADIVEDCTKNRFFGLVPWYQYIGAELNTGSKKADRKCEIKCFNVTEQTTKNACGQKKSDVPLVLLAIIDNLLRIAGIVAVAYVLYGGFRYVSSQGNPEQTGKAQSTILNALIGLAVAVISVSFIAFLGHKLGG